MTEFDGDSFPWPSARDDLLDTSGRWTGHALLDWQRSIDYGRAMGFRRSAEILVDHVRTHQSDQDVLIFPIANNWRHCLELQLKTLAVSLRALCDEPRVTPLGHDLMKLWREARAGVVRVHPEEPTDAFEHAERVLGQLHSLDPDGQNFRYHRRADGSLALPDVDRLDIPAFHSGPTALANLLDAVIEMIGRDLDLKRETEKEYRP
jgi:hypothetical protein